MFTQWTLRQPSELINMKNKDIKMTVSKQTPRRHNIIEKSKILNCSKVLIAILSKVWLHMNVAIEIIKNI